MGLLGVPLIHTIKLERLEGHTGQGASYKDPEQIDCYFESSQKLVKTSDGDEIISPAKLYLDSKVEPPPPESRVTFEGVTYEVIQPDPKDDLLNQSRHHTEVRLK